MPICPLWTGLILCRLSTSEQNLMSRYSNTIIENWMRILKKKFFGNQIKLTPADFIRKIHEGIQGRLKAFEFAFHPISSKIIQRVKNELTDKVRLKKFVKSERKRKRVTLATIICQTKLQGILENHVKKNFL